MVKVWCDRAVRSRVFFGVIQSVTGSLGAIATLLLLTPAVYAEAASDAVDTGEPITEAIAPLELTELDQPATTVDEWIAQIEASLTQITDVRVEETEAGLQIILETENGALAVPETRAIGNALIADIPNAAIAEEFSQANPIEGIALVSVTSLPGDRVRVAITGTDAPPVADVTTEAQGLVLAVMLGDADAVTEEDAIQVVVTGEQDEGYNPSSASTATRTDTPLRDIPQSIQVVPQQVLQDQQVTRLSEALRNVPGVARGGITPRFTFVEDALIRGFDANYLVNGLNSLTGFAPIFEASNIESVEVLRGPASVLYGQGFTGGIVNLVTKQPLSEPYYSFELSAGSFSFYRGSVDFSGPLNDNGTVLYRFTGAAQTTESFFDFYDAQRYSLAPTLTWQISDQTRITFEANYAQATQPFDLGLPAVGTILPNPNGDIPRDRYVSEPSDNGQYDALTLGYDFQHRFSDNWEIRNAFRFVDFNISRAAVFSLGLDPDGRTLNRGFQSPHFEETVYNLDTYVVGEFDTGSIEHQLVAGVNLFRRESGLSGFNRSAPPLDLFDPDYGQPLGDVTARYDNLTTTDFVGFYLQDQITLLENLKLLLGGRFDIATQESEDFLESTDSFQQNEAFSPRIGIVYQPIPAISLYGSYSRSFLPVVGRTADGSLFQPERGTQYEIGMKADLNDQLTATLAFYDLTRSNVETPDLENPDFSIQTGEQRSQGIEFNVAGEILPGWNVIGGYAYTDARITEDNTFDVGNQINNIPKHAFNLWTSYQLQEGDLEGLGFGLGLFFVGDRPGDLDNSFEIPSYLRTDAAIFYERDRFRAALNFRNIFDIDYFESAGNINRVILGEPFTVQGTLSWTF
ncbi:TonB-dependent siderophore receptor [Leptolyngbya sp. O-77]|uniref:TonB-dependent siderophore receptor n=1 Tax=Leptolyngbya sp. O-77 TaxID=1080068 RepID=UPI00074D48D4|nr:TonB-dependent siderophore receptor [Leptolyngbya sp. O-77]BAU40258.1 Ferrichrome-iron receptor precursor [Leptolyngbya sp. O-77]